MLPFKLLFPKLRGNNVFVQEGTTVYNLDWSASGKFFEEYDSTLKYTYVDEIKTNEDGELYIYVSNPLNLVSDSDNL